MKVSERQAAAIGASAGGLFISAGAGSGKTRVLTARFCRLVEEARADGAARPLDAVVAITFTEKAAGELAQRIRGTLSAEVGVDVARQAEGAWVSTIHGLCRRLLKRHAFEAGLDPAFGVCDEVDSAVLRREAFGQALRSLAGSEDVERLVADYDILELEAGVRDVDEYLRSLGAGPDELTFTRSDFPGDLADALGELRAVLSELNGLDGRKTTEEKNAAALVSLIATLEEVATDEPDAGMSVLDATAGFKQSESCRECAKPLAVAAKECVVRLQRSAAGHSAERYASAFIQVLKKTSEAHGGAKEERSLLDFEDLQWKVRELFWHRPELAEEYRKMFVEVMVDEFQDTNALQLSVIDAIAGSSLATVGDEMQSIYGWRNADVGLFRARRDALGPERSFPLPENYRSHPELVGFFNELFSAEPFWPTFMRLDAGFREEVSTGETEWPQREPRINLTLLAGDECSSAEKVLAEAEAVAAWFSSLRAAGAAQGDLVVLLRAMTHARGFEEALQARGFDVFVASGGTYFDAPEVAELEALLRVVSNTRDDEAFARVLAGRMASVSDDGLFLLRRRASSAGGESTSLWEAALAGDREPLSPSDEAAVALVVDVISEVRGQQGRRRLYELIRTACEDLGYEQTLLADGEPGAWGNALKFARMADEFERAAPGDPAAFLEYLAARRAHKRHEPRAAVVAEDVDAVRIMSVHAAKGLEFPVVAVAGLGSKTRRDGAKAFDCGLPDGRITLGVVIPADELPADSRRTSDAEAIADWRTQREIAEAKRILYVACTRATSALGLFGCVGSDGRGQTEAPIAWISTALGLPADAGEVGVRDACAGVRVQYVDLDARGDESTAEPARGADPEPRPSPAAATNRAVSTRGVAPTGTASRASDRREQVAQPMRPERVSFTGLQTFLDCSYRYYATSVAGLRGATAPSANGPRSIGDAVHAVLAQTGAGAGLEEERIAEVARRHGLDDEACALVRDAVEVLLGKDVVRGALSSETARREAPFAFDVSGTTVRGAIDLLDVQDGTALVIDYKTGRGQQDDVEVDRWRLQSLCYATAVFKGMTSVDRVEVRFIGAHAESPDASFFYERSDLPDLESEIDGLIGRVAAERPVPLPAYDARTCQECPAAGNLCPITAARPSDGP